jgi:hypothetical protein
MVARRFSGLSALVLFLLLVGCEEDERQKHPALTPQLTATISSLRRAAETVTGYGGIAKKIRRNADGQALYTKAVACHNACVSYIGTGLDAGFAEADLRSCLQEADAARTKLMDWCRNHARGRRPVRPEQGATALGADDVVELAANFLLGLLRDLLEHDRLLRKLEREERAAQIERIKQELKACECRQWDKL